jgi:hypothetical protein
LLRATDTALETQVGLLRAEMREGFSTLSFEAKGDGGWGEGLSGRS